jgi:hypothetical protein
LLSAPCFSITHTIGCSQALEHLRKGIYCISIYRVPVYFVDGNLFTVFLLLFFIIAVTALLIKKWMSTP